MRLSPIKSIRLVSKVTPKLVKTLGLGCCGSEPNDEAIDLVVDRGEDWNDDEDENADESYDWDY